MAAIARQTNLVDHAHQRRSAAVSLAGARWRPVDRRERRMTPFALALAASDPPKTARNSFGPKRMLVVADKTKKKSARDVESLDDDEVTVTQ